MNNTLFTSSYRLHFPILLPCVISSVPSHSSVLHLLPSPPPLLLHIPNHTYILFYTDILALYILPRYILHTLIYMAIIRSVGFGIAVLSVLGLSWTMYSSHKPQENHQKTK